MAPAAPDLRLASLQGYYVPVSIQESVKEAHGCEFCDNDAELLSANEQCGGMSYEAWPVCIDCEVKAMEQLLRGDELNPPPQVVVIAHIDNDDPGQASRLLRMAEREYHQLELNKLARKVESYYTEGNNWPSRARGAWERTLTFDVDEIGLVRDMLAIISKARAGES